MFKSTVFAAMLGLSLLAFSTNAGAADIVMNYDSGESYTYTNATTKRLSVTVTVTDVSCSTSVRVTAPGTNKTGPLSVLTAAGETNAATVQLKTGETVVVEVVGSSPEGQYTVCLDAP